MGAKINTNYHLVKNNYNHFNSPNYNSKVSTQSLSNNWLVSKKASSHLTQPYKVTFSNISSASSQKSSANSKTHNSSTSSNELFGFISNIKKDISETARKAQNNVNNFVSSASKTISTTIKSVEQKVSSAAKVLTQSINNLKKDLKQTAENVKQKVQQFINAEKSNNKTNPHLNSTSTHKVPEQKNKSGTYVITKNTSSKSSNTSANSKSSNTLSIDMSPYNPTKSPGNALGNAFAAKDIVKYTKAYKKDGFTIKVTADEKYAIIKGARTESALKEGIKGTRYAFKNAEKYPEVFRFVEPKVAVKEAFNVKNVGTKVAIAGVAIDTGIDIYNDIKNKAEPTKVAADAVVDVAFGAGNVTASAWAGAIAGSAFGPIGTAVGAVVGGLGYTFFTESFEVNGKSLKDAVKQITKKAFDHIAY
jgi:gas vesicle protein